VAWLDPPEIESRGGIHSTRNPRDDAFANMPAPHEHVATESLQYSVDTGRDGNAAQVAWQSETGLPGWQIVGIADLPNRLALPREREKGTFYFFEFPRLRQLVNAEKAECPLF
jgi:hypothetical protein